MAKWSETQLCAQLVKEARKQMPWAVIFNHNDRATAGVPDVSITAERTVWLELKLGDFKSTSVQELTAKRLARYGTAFYVIYAESGKEIYVVHPTLFPAWSFETSALNSKFQCKTHKELIQWLAPLVRGQKVDDV